LAGSVATSLRNDDHGRPVSSALYFYRLSVGSKELTGRIVALR
jgi:hypothetical protein